MTLPELRKFLESHLLEEVMPFWEKHALCDEGGINTCIRDDGTLISEDKWLWSQWRSVWVFSRLYRKYGDEKWLDIAKGIFDFARQGWLKKERGWALLLDRDGKVKRGCESLYVDGFAIYGLTEYARAAGCDKAARLAVETGDAVIEKLEQPHDRIPHFPYPVPAGARVHGLPMIFSLVFWELGQHLDIDRYRETATSMANDIFAHFYRPERDLVLERISDDNSEYPPPLGTAVVPGHVIEDIWFQIHIARDSGKPDRVEKAVRAIRRHLKAGWDDEHGGLLLAVDADGATEVGWDFADTKLWWPHTEAMYALLAAYEHSREPWCLDWYGKIHDYSFARFPVPEHGEWRQKLDRHGNPITDTVALPVKDPFHLPRALLLSVEALERMEGNRNTA